jgi:2,4-dienoyl-CoA reductase-like NADH-dependent reductase (Old Yellow Enzyme family)
VHLLSEVEKFLRISKIPAARFGREVMHDPRFVFDLRNGREPRDRTVNRVLAFLKEAM